MRVQLETAEGRTYQMPPPLSCRVRWTGGTPCDDMEVTTAYDGALAEVLPQVCRFAVYEETLLLRGVVDEYEAAVSGQGELLTVSGRGMLALLLDNEAEAAFYQRATAAELAREHVEIYQIPCRVEQRLGPREGYQVASGSSRWKAVSGFTQYVGGFDPYMTPGGELIVGPWTGRQVALDRWPILACRRRERRHGVLSQVVVRDKSRGTRQVVEDPAFIRRGGCAWRVIYTPGRSSWAAMRYTGDYQIRRAKEGAVTAEVVLAGAADVRPGDQAALRYGPLGLDGTFRVAAAELRLDSGGVTTTVTLHL